MSVLTINISFNGKKNEITCQSDELIETPLKDFVKAERKKFEDFVFYYKGVLIENYKQKLYELFRIEKETKIFNIFAIHLLENDNAISSGETQEETKGETKAETKEETKAETSEETKEEKKAEIKDEQKEFYYDIVCPECQTSAIIDINSDNEYLSFQILNCENFHNLKNKNYDIYQDLDLDRIPVKCNICSTHLTPPENKLLYCTCGNNVCNECDINHTEPGHTKIEFKDKNYICLIHQQSFNSYCIDCNANFCEKCQELHKEHKIYKYEEIEPDKDVLLQWKQNIQKQKTKLKNYVDSTRKLFDEMINTVESYFNSFIRIENTLVNRYDAGFKNFQLLRNLVNTNIFDNNIYSTLEKYIKNNMDPINRFNFLYKNYNQISGIKANKKNVDEQNSDGNNEITINYDLKGQNKLNRYVKILDEIFVKNNSEKLSVLVNKVKQKELKAYYHNINDDEKLEVVLKEQKDKKCVTDMSYMINNIKTVTSVNFNKWTTQNITSMEALFQLSPFEKIPEKIFEAPMPNLTNIRALFCKCVKIKDIPDLKNIFCKNNKLQNISMIFNGCKNLTVINGNNWYANNLVDISYAFNRCENLSEIHLGNIATNNVKSLCGVFNCCKKLIKLPSVVSKWNTQNAEDISIMFQECNMLKSIDIKNYNTSKVKDMNGVFSLCKELKSVNGIKSWNMNEVKEMIGMFNGCESLEKLEFGKYNLNNVTNASGMFYNCKKLQTIKGAENWRFNQTTKLDNIFDQSGFNKRQDMFDNWKKK